MAGTGRSAPVGDQRGQVPPRARPGQPPPVGQLAQLAADRLDLCRSVLATQRERNVLGHHRPRRLHDDLHDPPILRREHLHPHAFLAVRDQPHPTRPARHHHRLRLHDARRPPSPVRRLGPLPEHHLGRLQAAQLGVNLRQLLAQQLGPLSQAHPPLDRPRQQIHHAPPSRCGTYETPWADHPKTREPARGRRSPANDHVRDQHEHVNLHPHKRPDLRIENRSMGCRTSHRSSAEPVAAAPVVARDP